MEKNISRIYLDRATDVMSARLILLDCVSGKETSQGFTEYFLSAGWKQNE